MLFEQASELQADQLPYQQRRMFALEPQFAFTPATNPHLSVRRAQLADSRLFRVRSTGHRIELIEPECTSMLIPRRGTIEVRTRRSTFVARPGETLLLAPNRRVTTVVPDSSGVYECDCVLIPTATKADDQPADRLPLHTREQAFSGNPSGRPDGPVRGILEYLFNQGMLADSPLAADAVRNSASILVKELMAELIGRLDEAGALGSSSSGREARLVRSAEALMLARLDRPVTVGEMAAQLGVSVRGLQYAFQRVRGAGPRTVLGRLRLERARQRLADPHDDGTVTEVALACGVAHFGRFAAAYAARYGELPSDTRRRAGHR